MVEVVALRQRYVDVRGNEYVTYKNYDLCKQRGIYELGKEDYVARGFRDISVVDCDHGAVGGAEVYGNEIVGKHIKRGDI